MVHPLDISSVGILFLVSILVFLVDPTEFRITECSMDFATKEKDFDIVV